jgi:signal transduction histidine kinase
VTNDFRFNGPWMQALSDAWQAGLIVIGDDGSPDFATRKACELFGASDLDELRERWPHNTELLAALKAAPANGDAAVEVNVPVRSERGATAVHCQVFAISEEDCAGHLVIAQSGDRVAKVERSLRQAARHRGLASLYRDLAHDLKGSLNAMAVTVELIGRAANTGALAPPHGVGTIRDQIARLDRTISALLDRSVVDGVARQRLDLRVLVDAIVEIVRGRCRAQRVELIVDVPDTAIEIDGWPDQLHAALLNLVVNALDAMPDGGRIRISAVSDSSSGMAHLVVCDTGPGVAPADRALIWRLYHTTKEEGSGIGLHVVRSVARAHGGTAELLPSEGCAPYTTCFRLSLPVVLNR